MDETPRFHVEVVLWILCAKRHLPADRFTIIVYFIGTVPPDLADWIRAQGIETRNMRPVVEGSPHCNKIAPFFDPHGTDYTIVCDVDLYIVDDLSCFITSDCIRAAPNNHCNPPPHIFHRILSASGLGRAYRPGMALFKGWEGMRETHINNISGGIVVAPSVRQEAFARLWKKWAYWLVENRTLLDQWAVHVDQVAFALTMEELREDVEFLPPHTNAILHLLEEISTVYAVHLTSGHIPQFPQRFNADRTLNSDGLSQCVVHAFERLNACIREAVVVISELPSTRNHMEKFLNPNWIR